MSDFPVHLPPFVGPPFLGRQPAITTVPDVDGISPNSGRTCGGLFVTVTGNRFKHPSGATPVVTIGGIPLTSVVVVSNTILTGITGASSTSGLKDVIVTVSGQSGTLFGAFTYIKGTIAKVVPQFGPIAGGTSIVIEGYHFKSGTLVYFDNVLASSIEFIDENHIVCVTPPHATGFVDVKIVEP